MSDPVHGGVEGGDGRPAGEEAVGVGGAGVGRLPFVSRMVAASLGHAHNARLAVGRPALRLLQQAPAPQ